MTVNKSHLKHILELNFAVVLISTSGTLGRYITLDPFVTITFRAILAGIVLYLFCRFRKFKINIANKKDLFKVVVGGCLMGIHWVTYFYSLSLSSVAIGMLSIYTYPVITTFLEPLLLKTRFSKMHLGLAVLVLFGIYFLVPEFSFENDQTLAVAFGVTSAFFYSLRNLLMKQEVEKYNGSVLMMYQMIIITIMLSPVLFLFDLSAVPSQLPPILVLAIVTTCFGHTLLLISFRNFSVTAASIISSAQPVYGILLGLLFLGEYPAVNTIIGGILIVFAVFAEIFRSIKREA
ncbi:DMT family transporter [Autumnicola edwardsiae]|uniref:DMT family transporter n=1 Tax=Autumnicola edwardsiae TaxID=3075594 RepID=A0ABU3CTF7_9FLAO|nr:DMT family transporter [Zunongwangia sp. F297]MDT0649556.1 DMT family transporter [Zunongwangia sp. F297]